MKNTLVALLLGLSLALSPSLAVAQDGGGAPAPVENAEQPPPQPQAPTDAGAPAGDRRWFVHSNWGPAVGEGALAMGGRIYLLTAGIILPLPSFDIWYRRAFHEYVDLEVHAHTFFLLNWIDVGARSKFYGNESFSLGGRFDLTAIIGGASTVGDGGSSISFIFGVTPGLIASFGTKTFQFSVALDFPLALAGGTSVSFDDGSGGSASGSGFLATMRPTLAAEFAVSPTVDMYIDLQFLIPFDAPGAVFQFLPVIIGIGAAW